MTKPELQIWDFLRTRPGGMKFRRQHSMGPYVLDFFCHSAALAVEVNGSAHGMGDRPERDDRRDVWLEQQGVRTLRVNAADAYRDMDAVWRMIVHAAETRDPTAGFAGTSPAKAREDDSRLSSPAFAGEGDHAQHGGGATLYDFHRSSAAYRVRIALNLKGIPYTSVTVNLAAGEQRTDEHRARNPQGFVPMLEIDGQRLTQSVAIIDYLNAAYPLPPLTPFEAEDRAHVEAMVLLIACDIHPLNNLRVLKYLTGPLRLSDEAKDAWYRHWVSEGFAALETMAASRAGTFLFGDAPTVADVLLVPQMYNARRFAVPLDAYPTLLRADAAACELEPFADAHPDRVKAADRVKPQGE